VSLLDDETKLVTSRLGTDRFRVAGTAEFNGVNKDIRADRIAPLVRLGATVLPRRGHAPGGAMGWPAPDDAEHDAAGGRGRAANAFYNTGHGHLGWTLSAVTADMVSEIVAQGLRQEGARRFASAGIAPVSPPARRYFSPARAAKRLEFGRRHGRNR